VREKSLQHGQRFVADLQKALRRLSMSRVVRAEETKALRLLKRLASHYWTSQQRVSLFAQDAAERPLWALPEDQQRRMN
jgi:hypothetical protein